LSAPVIDPRDQAQVLGDLAADLPGYVPELEASKATAAMTLMRIVSRYASSLIGGINQMPQREFMAYLDMLGTHLLPAQAAEAPLVFTLAPNTPVDVTLPQNSQVAAPPPPVVPSQSSGASTASSSATAPQPLLFSTEEPITLSRAQLKTLYSVDPGSDQFADHSSTLTAGFTLFDNMLLTEHAIYLAHDTLFAFQGSVYLLLLIGLRSGTDSPLAIQWEYFGANGWVALIGAPEDDTTDGLENDGTIILQRAFAPPAKQTSFAGINSYWVRGKLTSPMLPDGIAGRRTVPVINTIQTRLRLSKTDLAAEAAFADTVSLDVSKDFYPFGQQPSRFATFYLASKEVFQRQGANVQIAFTLRQPGMIQGSLTLAWEYFNGSWNDLGISYQLTTDGAVNFLCPRDWQQTTINGVKNYWMRVRITSGGFGCPLRVNTAPVATIIAVDSSGTISQGTILTVKDNSGYCGGEPAIVTPPGSTTGVSVTVQQRVDPNQLILTSILPANTYTNGSIGPPLSPSIAAASLQPPVVKLLTLKYSYYTDPTLLDHCLSRNDFVFEDHSEACRWPDQTFTPFHPVSDIQAAVHFGFDKPLPAGLVSLYADIPQAVAQGPRAAASPFFWEYFSANGWSELGVLDETSGFQRSGMIQFAGQPDALPMPGLGGTLYWVRARLKVGEELSPASVHGIWLNAVWAIQRTSNATELVGTSDGNPGQSFLLQHIPVLAGEIIEVQEWTGSGDAWKLALGDVPQSDLRFETNSATGVVTAVWVRWHEQPNLYSSGPRDRHYIIERATGLIRFGPPGMIPPGGNPISATYSSGGGIAGNVPEGSISQLHTAIPYVMGVTNPIAASGGTDTENTASVAARGPRAIRSRDRAVSPADYEWLARQASPDVAKARCVPSTGPDGHSQRGWVTLVVVPASLDLQPEPTPEFQVRILNYLAARAPFAAASQIRIAGPEYSPIDVSLEVVPKEASLASSLETQLRDNLDRFLHPLSGGASGQGWDFGQPLYISQIAAVVEATPGVDYVPQILLKLNGQVFDDFVPVDPGSLLTSGTHEIRLTIL
jgi:hypothetical protein